MGSENSSGSSSGLPFQRTRSACAQAEFFAATVLGRTDEIGTRPDPYSCALGDSEHLRHPPACALGTVAGRLGETGSGGVVQQLLDDGERGHEGSLTSGHQGRCGFVEAGAVLDTARPGLDRIPYVSLLWA